MELYIIQLDGPLGQLFEWVSEIQKLIISVLDMASLGLDNCLQPFFFFFLNHQLI